MCVMAYSTHVSIVLKSFGTAYQTVWHGIHDQRDDPNVECL
jgi:hypothetical protein